MDGLMLRFCFYAGIIYIFYLSSGDEMEANFLGREWILNETQGRRR